MSRAEIKGPQEWHFLLKRERVSDTSQLVGINCGYSVCTQHYILFLSYLTTLQELEPQISRNLKILYNTVIHPASDP